MPDIEQITVVEKQKAVALSDLDLAREALDQAADAGDLREIKNTQAEISGLQVLIDSCTRRLARLSKETTDAEKQALRDANNAAVKGYATEAKKLISRAQTIGGLVATLAAELQAFEKGAQVARLHFCHVYEQSKLAQHSPSWSRAEAAGFGNSFLGNALCEEMRKAGIFYDMAQTPQVSFDRLDWPPIDEFFKRHSETMNEQIVKLRDDVNAAI